MSATLATSLISDLSKALVQRAPLLDRTLEKRGRLLLIVDDYERTRDVLGEFLLGHVVRALESAGFESLLIVIGRDRLKSTAPGWGQHHQDSLLDPIDLVELSSDEAEAYIRMRGIDRAEAVARIIRDTAGYPYLLAAEVDDELEGGSSALSRKNFFDRTTQWMTSEQKDWSKRLAFLDEISLETIALVVPDLDRAGATKVLEWFKSEASLRSPSSSRWALRPMIKTKLKEYVQNDSQADYDELSKRAAQAVRT